MNQYQQLAQDKLIDDLRAKCPELVNKLINSDVPMYSMPTLSASLRARTDIMGAWTKRVIKECANQWSVTAGSLTRNSRLQDIVSARDAAIWIIYNNSEMTHKQISKKFNMEVTSTVTYSLRKSAGKIEGTSEKRGWKLWRHRVRAVQATLNCTD